MYIMSNVEGLLRYASKSTVIEIKPRTATYVDESIISFEELQGCYGTRIFRIEDSEARRLLGIEEPETAEEVNNPPETAEEDTTEIIDDVVVPVVEETTVEETVVEEPVVEEPVVEETTVEEPVVEETTVEETTVEETVVEESMVEVPATDDSDVEILVIGATETANGETIVDAGELFSAMQKKEETKKAPARRKRSSKSRTSKSK